MSRPPLYVLGHSADELARLERQSAWFAPVTLSVLQQAGVGPGMRVIDVGCGAGDVSVLLASLVGPAGRVHAVDRAPEAVAATRQRVAARRLGQVDVQQSELDTLVADPAHAAVGRFVLMHQADPAATLAHLARLVVPGGRIVMIESYLDALGEDWACVPPSPAFTRLLALVRQTIRGAGGRTDMGMRLRQTFLDAGLADPEIAMHVPLSGPKVSDASRFWCDSFRSMSATAAELGVAAVSASEIDDLERRMRAELGSPGAVVALPPVVTAWSAVR